MNADEPILQLVGLENVVGVSASMRASGGETKPTNQLAEPDRHPALEPDVQYPKAHG